MNVPSRMNLSSVCVCNTHGLHLWLVSLDRWFNLAADPTGVYEKICLLQQYGHFEGIWAPPIYGHFEYILNVLNTCHADFLGDVYRLSGANRLLHVNVRHTGGTTVHGIPSLRYLQKRPPCVCQEASTQSQVNPSLLLDYSRMFPTLRFIFVAEIGCVSICWDLHALLEIYLTPHHLSVLSKALL